MVWWGGVSLVLERLISLGVWGKQNDVAPPRGFGSPETFFALVMGTLVAGGVIYLAIGAITMATSGGNESKIEEGKSMIKRAITGIVFVVCAGLLSRLLLSLAWWGGG